MKPDLPQQLDGGVLAEAHARMPPMTRVRRHFKGRAIRDVGRALRCELDGSGVTVAAGSAIAIAVGSRGIANLVTVVAGVVAWVKAAGGRPFIVPAMGSHGGATAEGQRALLAGYGVTEGAVGAPVRSSMDVVELARGDLEIPAFYDRHAFDADGTIVINRVKPHTDYHGPYESGLMKMVAVGLGKQRQAMPIHSFGVPGLRDLMPRVARHVLVHGNVLLGVGLVENARDETCRVAAVPAGEIPEREPKLLALARRNMARLPVDVLDVLVIDEMGKDVSGVGLDSNVIGRLGMTGQRWPTRPRIGVILVRDLTEATHGNAVGMGLADVITRRLFDGIDFRATYENLYTSGFLERGRVPVVAPDDRAAVAFALRGAQVRDPSRARIVHIRNTLCLGEMRVSPAVLAEMAGRADVEVLETLAEPMGGDGELVSV